MKQEISEPASETPSDENQTETHFVTVVNHAPVDGLSEIQVSTTSPTNLAQLPEHSGVIVGPQFEIPWNSELAPPKSTGPSSAVQPPNGVSRFDAALMLQGINQDDQDDKERRRAAFEMSQRWGKLRTISWVMFSIGIDRDRKTYLFDVVRLVTVLADVERGLVIRYGGEIKLITDLREKARQPLSVEDSVAIRARRTTRTTRVSTKAKESSVANQCEDIRGV